MNLYFLILCFRAINLKGVFLLHSLINYCFMLFVAYNNEFHCDTFILKNNKFY